MKIIYLLLYPMYGHRQRKKQFTSPSKKVWPDVTLPQCSRPTTLLLQPEESETHSGPEKRKIIEKIGKNNKTTDRGEKDRERWRGGSHGRFAPSR